MAVNRLGLLLREEQWRTTNSLKRAHIRLYHLSKQNSDSPPLLEQFYASSSSSNESNSTPELTQLELHKINLLIPRLCLSGHLTTAIHLTTTSLLSNPPPPIPKSISFSILIHFLTSHPDMAKSMSLLTILRHTPQSHPYLSSISTMLITSYIKNKRLKEAFKVYQWMLRPGSPFSVEKFAYEALVNGFCEFGLNLEALRILRDMGGAGFVPGGGLRRRVYRSLLKDARVNEALALDQALATCFHDANGGSLEKLQELLDSMIRSWTGYMSFFCVPSFQSNWDSDIGCVINSTGPTFSAVMRLRAS